MHLRLVLTVLVLAVVSTSGCVENMDELKEVLGFKEQLPTPPEPVYAAPIAKAQVNTTMGATGVELRFTSNGSRDPQGLALTFTWSFGDSTSGTGPVVTHAYATPGDFTVILNVSNSQGLSDEDVLTVTVKQPNRAPVASFVIQDANRNVTSGETGRALSFNASGSYDVDADSLTYVWTFGDGSTSIEPSPTHTYQTPGLHTVRLKVDDGSRNGEASRIIAINGTLNATGNYRVGDDATKRHSYPVAEGARLVDVRLTFDAALGANDLTLIVRDANGTEVGRSDATTPPGAQGTQVRTMALAEEVIKRQTSGEWSFEVLRTKGVQIDYALVVRETF